MTWPELIPACYRRTPVELHVYGEGLDENGAPEEVYAAMLYANWQDGGGTELTPEQKTVRLSGRAFFSGDVCPSLPVISGGYGVIFGVRRRIVRGVKARNPDGTVNFTEVRFA